MATSKQPRFPHPPLEIGVPQYPTPNVPDFYTKDGHIILIEKVSAEKGGYTPQPLDGSITYKKRDANKWPSELYLVYQSPTEDGEHVYNYWANDRTLASQDAWNFGLDYSSNNPAYPITTRTYIVPRDQYETVPLGSTDPVFGGNQIISQQKKVELGEDNPLHSRYVAVQRVYETIPGPVLTGKKLDQRGDLETITTQTVVAGTAPAADGLLVTQTSVEPVDSVKSTKTIGTVESYATLITKANKAGLLGDTSTTDDIVDPSTNPDALSTSVLESSVEALTATKSRKRTTISSGPTNLSGEEYKSGLLGETTKSESIVSYGSSPDELSTTVLNSVVEPIDEYKSKKTTIEATGPTLLSGASNKSGLLGVTSTTESIVAYGSGADALSTTILQSEVTPIDAYKSKRTTTTASGPTELDGKELAEFGIAVTKEKIVPYYSSPNINERTIKSEIQPIDAYKSKLTQVDYSSISTLTGYQYDDQFEANLSITKTIVAAGTADPSHQNGVLSYKDEPINPYQSQRIIVSTPSLPPTRTEYYTGTFTSPTLIFGLNSAFVDLSCGDNNDFRVIVRPSSRASQSGLTTFKAITSYSYGPPTEGDTDLFSPTLRQMTYSGIFVNFDFDGVLCDDINVVAPCYYCGGIQIACEAMIFPATTPTASEYLGYIGEYKKTSWESKYWKAGIWQSREIWTKLI
jgi:hypothetical protein